MVISNINVIFPRGIGLFFLVAIALFVAPFVVFAGFGVSPPGIIEDRLVAGSHFEKIIYLVQGNPEEDVDMNIIIDSSDIKDWISFEQGTEFTIPAGVQQFPLNVVIDVPKNAELGAYKAFIRVNTKPKKATEGGQVAIALGGRVDVELTVGDGIVYEYKVSGIKMFNIKEGKNPKISVAVKNTGNVPAAPSNASFELFNKYGNIRLAYAENNNFEKVPAFQEKTGILEFPIDIRLAPGEYWGHVRVYDDNNVIKELRTVFNVKKGGISGLMAAVGSVSSSIILSIIAVVVAFIIFVAIKRITSRRKRKISKKDRT